VSTHRFTRLAAGAATVALLAAPAAGARPITEPGGQPRPGSVQERHYALANLQRSPEAQPTVVRFVDSGFDWTSAAIGAGGAAGLLALAAAGAATVSHRHRPTPTA
jgi:hypothetical protein